MIELPELGERVRVWPVPGLKVQDGPRALADGGRFLSPDGREVVWSYHLLEQLRHGEILLHDPRPKAAPDASADANKE